MNIQALAEEDKLGLMPGAFLHDLWEYHQKVQSNLTSDIEEFETPLLEETEPFLEGASCYDWFDSCVSSAGTASVLDFTEFHLTFVEHGLGLNPKYGEKYESCSNISQEDLRAIWEALMTAVKDSIAKVGFTRMAASSNDLNVVYRLNLISRSALKGRGLKMKFKPGKLLFRRSIQTCQVQTSSSSHLTLSISASIDWCWSRRLPFSETCSPSPNLQTT
jgi:hypothetical protein